MDDKYIEVYIRCTACNFEQVLRRSSVEIERLRRLKVRWEAYDRAARVKYGVPSSLARAQLFKLRQRIRELGDEIED